MKRLLPAFLLLAACASPEAEKAKFPYAEVFEQKLGTEKVYGLRIYDFNQQAQQRVYALQLELENKVWTDTLYSEVPARDTVINEVVFSEARVTPNKNATYRLQLLDAE